MDEQEFQDLLHAAILDYSGQNGSFPVKQAHTYKSVGMLTMNDGLVIRMEDGSEFQITIVQSREAKAA